MSPLKKTANKSLKTKKKTDKRATTLGPIEDLENYVPSDWWNCIFNSLYLKTDSDVVEDHHMTRKEVDLFSKIVDLKNEDNILDLCCGQGRHVLELSRRGFKAEGLDRSRFLVQKAKATARKENISVRFREGDARKLPFSPDAFEVVMMLGNSFGYFETVQDDLRILKEIFRVLKPWGRLLLDVTDGEYLKKNFQNRSWEWIDKKLFVCRERTLSADEERLISREIVTDVTKGTIADQFYAERLYTRDNLIKLFEKAGFSDTAFHGEISTNSVRNQDLGMMEKRIIITGKVKKEWSRVPKKLKKDPKKQIVVIFGDPNKPDTLKPCGVFDEDDFYTIDQLKSALQALPEYDFSYLSNHDTMIQDLSRSSGKIHFVFNLCDEGFNNDPRKELHLPALLEVLDIPYTGSSTQCLAFCYDKSLVRGIASEMGIPVSEAFFIEPDDTTFNLPFSFPVIVKPNYGDSSFGITQQSVANNFEQLLNAISMIREKLGYDKPILVEEFLTGKDLSVGVIGNPLTSYNVLPIAEEDYSAVPEELPRVCGYEAKWIPDSPYYKIKTVPAKLPEKTEKFIVECCMKLFERLECRDYCRFDWRLDAKGHPKLLEVNPNPGWCWDGHLAKMAKFAEMSYAEMIRAILDAAEQRLQSPHVSDVPVCTEETRTVQPKTAFNRS
ncbi:MAG: methyltransferase domain-containing protein [Proteobacteria bacterium]|nr:methyltransferase domain-containing protein [Pseudomonadota bacterium]